MATSPPEAGGAPGLPSTTYASGIRTGGAVQTATGSGSRAAARAKRQAKQDQKTATDASGTNLSSNDQGGFGLDRPYLQWGFYQSAQEAAPSVTTASGTFVALWTVSSEPQHPKVRVRVRVVNGVGTTAEVKLVDRLSGTTISSILAVGSGATVEDNLDGTLISPSLSGSGAPLKVDVHARRTGGAGSVGVLILHAVGKGS